VTGWVAFGAAFAAFLGAHAVPARPSVRRRLVGLLGERIYLTLYVTVSLGLLWLLIHAADRATSFPLWSFAPWQLWVPLLAMPVVCLLAAFGTAAVNPLSFGGRQPDRFDPEAPGIAGITRHPLLWALALWSAAHVVPNGNAAHVILFGTFVIFSLAGMVAIDRRLRRRLGVAEWARLAARTSLVPLAAVVTGRHRTRGPREWLRVVVAVVAFVALLLAHGDLLGVSALPLILR